MLGSIKKSFQAIGVWPIDAKVILKRFNNKASRQANTLEIGEYSDGDSSH